jgi:multidrug resistance efflux pump
MNSPEKSPEKNTAETMSENTPQEEANKAPADPVKRWTVIVLVICSLLLFWHLRADRFTPYTTQARMHALVVPIAPNVSGNIIKVAVDNNQWVSKGDELFRIDLALYELAVQAAEADLESSRQATGSADASVSAARANIQMAEANFEKADQDYQRMKRIREEDPGAISERRVETAQSAVKAASSQVASAKASLEGAIQNLGQAGEQNSRILKAQAGLQSAQINLAYTSVSAPDDGLVTDVRIDVGNFAAAGQAQMTFIALHNVWIEADFTENNLGHLDKNDRVEILFDALPGQVFAGKIREIGFGVDIGSAPLGSLPTIDNDRQWLRDEQRFPVQVVLDQQLSESERRVLKVGSQASVMAYSENHWMLNGLGWLYIRAASFLTYAY